MKPPRAGFDQRPLRLGLCGLGAVGGAVFRLLCDHRRRRQWSASNARSLELVHVGARNLRGVELRAAGEPRHSKDVLAVATDPEVDVLIELIGGCDTARTLVEAALDSGKHVVTANKALLALAGDALFSRAAQNKVAISWEAAVGGGIPLVRTLQQGLSANSIRRIAGILNGTGNYIVSSMAAGGSFAEALQQAQQLGYAEANPEADISGSDAAHKISLLAALSWGLSLPGDKPLMHLEGIAELEQLDFSLAAEFGYRIRPLALADADDKGRVLLRVHPALVPCEHWLAAVDDVRNGVLVEGDVVGEIGLCGPGAGGDATASAVLADLLMLAAGVPPPHPAATYGTRLRTMDSLECRHYLRFNLRRQPEASDRVAAMLKRERVGLCEQRQEPVELADGSLAVALLTEPLREDRMRTVLSRLPSADLGSTAVVRLRVEDFGAERRRPLPETSRQPAAEQALAGALGHSD